MSYKSGFGKNLQGNRGSESGGSINIGDIINSLNTSGTVLTNVTLQNASIFSGSINDVTIGDVAQNTAFFASVTLGVPPLPDGTGGKHGDFVLYGDFPGDNITWNPAAAILNMNAGLTVRDATNLGNIKIFQNTITASNVDGPVKLIPNSANSAIQIGGNLEQNVAGKVSFLKSSIFQVKATDTLTLVSKNDAVLGSIIGKTTIKSDYGKSTLNIASVVFDILNNKALITTTALHNLESDDAFDILDTNSIDGRYHVYQKNSDTSFTIEIQYNNYQNFTNKGFVKPVVSGKIYIDANGSVNFNTSVPLTFGENSDLNILASIDTVNPSIKNLAFTASNIIFNDPIPNLQTSFNSFTDSGISVSYDYQSTKKTAFFGFRGSTRNFTWIPEATINIDSAGKKTVLGEKGIMELEGVLINRLIGNPNLILDAHNGSVNILASGQVNMPSIPLVFGNNGSIIPTNTSLIITSRSDIVLLPSQTNNGRIIIPDNTLLQFSFNQNITGGQQGLTLTGPVINLNGLVNIGGGLAIGSALNSITGDSNNLYIGASQNIVLNPGHILQIHDNILFQIGDVANTGLIANNGVLTMKSASNLQLTSLNKVSITASGGEIFMNSNQTIFPVQSEILFGPLRNKYISSMLNNLAFYSNTTLDFSTSIMNLNVLTKVQMPQDTRLSLGQVDIFADSQDNGNLHINNKDVFIDKNLTVNGKFIVNGSSTEIRGVLTTFKDPIIILGKDAPSVDVKDRGIEFSWFQTGNQKMGFMGFSQQNQYFELISDGNNDNEVYTANTYGDLRIRKLIADSVEVNSFNTRIINGTPDIDIVARNISLTASGQISFPQTTYISSGRNVLRSLTSGWSLDSPNVSFPAGSVTIGETLLKMTDVNNFHIGNVPNIYLDSIVYIKSSLRFGTDQVSINVDVDSNIRVSAPGNIILTSKTIFSNGILMGNASMNWVQDVAGGNIQWKSTLPNSDLNVSIVGNIRDANWMGSTIQLGYGGTGHIGAWHSGSLVYVGDSSQSLEEDNANLFYNHTTSCLGIKNNNPQNTLTIGGGNIDLLDNNANIIYRTNNSYSWSVGKNSTHYVIAGSFVSGLQSITSLNPYFVVNKYGQVGIGESIPFMNGLSGLQTESLLYVAGSITFSNPSNAIYWSKTEYISGENNSLNFHSSLSINYLSNVLFQNGTSYLEQESRIFGTTGGILTITSVSKLFLDSPHVVIPNRLCLHHDSNDTCQVYLTRKNDSSLAIVNDTGDIFLSPVLNVQILDNKNFVFGNSGFIKGSSSNLVLHSYNNLNFFADNKIINIPVSTKLLFGNVSSIHQEANAFIIDTTSPVNVNTSSVTIPVNSSINFGNNLNKITCDGDTLFISSPDLVDIVSNNVRISGNLIVSKQSTVTIASETNFDSGVIILGGAQMKNITNMTSFNTTSTLVTVDSNHNLKIGDTVVIVDTIPNIDNTYSVQQVLSPTSFSVAVNFPGIPAGVDQVSGYIRTPLTVDPGHDVGMQINWNNGTSVNTDSSRLGFIGFKRSSKRLTFIPEASKNNNIFIGAVGDIEVGNVYAQSISVTQLGSSLNTGSNLVSGINFQINGGSINSTVIGALNPANGTFTNLRVTTSLTIDFTSIVTNLNADMVDNHHAIDFMLRNGTLPLTGNWNAGLFRITASGFTDTTLQDNYVVIAGSGGKLISLDLTYISGVFKAPTIQGNILGGTISGTTLNISGNSTLTGNTTLQAILFVTNTADSTLYTNGSVVLSGGLGIAKSVNINGTLSVALTTNVTVLNISDIVRQTSTVDSTSLQTGAFILSGGMSIVKNLFVGGNLNVSGQLTSSLFNGNVLSNLVTGQTGNFVNLNVSNISNLTTVNVTGTFNGTNIITQDLSSTGIVSANRIVTTSSAESVSVSTGSIITSGGVGIAKSLYVGNILSVAGELILNNKATITGTLNQQNTTESVSIVTGATVISGGLGVAKNVNIGGNLNIAGTLTATLFSGNVTGSSVDSVNGKFVNLNVTGLTQVNAITAQTLTSVSATFSSMNVTGNSFFSGSIACLNDTDSVSPITGSITTVGGLGVVKSVNIGNTLTVNKTTYLQDIIVEKQFTQLSTTETISVDTGAMVLAGGLGIKKSVFIGGNLNVAGTLSSGTFYGNFQGGTISGTTASFTNLVVSGNTSLHSTTATSFSSTTANISSTLVAGNTTITSLSSGAINATTITASGALQAGNTIVAKLSCTTLDASSQVNFADTLTVTGGTRLTSLILTQSLSGTTATFSGNLTTANAFVSSLTSTGSITGTTAFFSSNLNVAEDTFLTNLTVSGLLTGTFAIFSNNVEILGTVATGALTGTTAHFTENVVIDKTLTANSIVTNNISAVSLDLSGYLNVGGTTTLHNLTANATTLLSATITNNLSVSGNTNLVGTTTTTKIIASDTITGTKATFSDTLSVTGNSVFSTVDATDITCLSVTTNNILSETGTFSGILTLQNKLVGVSATLSSNLTVSGNTSLQNTSVLNLSVTSTVDSVSSTTGCLVLAGGLGIGKSVNIKNYLTVIGGISASNKTINNVAYPILPHDAANKEYVDAVAQGLDIKDSVQVATTHAQDLSVDFEAGMVIDDVLLTKDMRILVKDQVNKVENGIYVVTNTVPVRSIDMPIDYSAAGAFTFIEKGTVNMSCGWVVSNYKGNDVVNTNSIVFVQFSGAGLINAGDGLTKNGNLMYVNVDTSSIEIFNDVLRVSSGLAGNGLSGGSGNSLSVNTDNFSIEIYQDILQIASSTLGTGLLGGSGTIISVNPILSHVTSVGTLTNGTWNASVIDVTYGGTGNSNFTSGRILVGKGTLPIETFSSLIYSSGVLSSLNIHVTDTTTSINYQSGALTVAGGVGISGDVYINKTLHVAETATLYRLGVETSVYVGQNVTIMDTLSSQKIDSFTLVGNVDLNAKTLTNGIFTNSAINTTNIVISAGKTFNASLGTVVFANDQISGDWISGGLADIDISGNSATVTNGVYKTDFGANTILKADTANNPIALIVPEATFIGRKIGQNISALTITETREILDLVEKDFYLDNSILKADVAGNPIPLVFPVNTILARKNGNIRTMDISTAQDFLDITQKSLYNANTILVANTDNTPEPLVVQESGIVGRKTGQNISSLTQQESRDIVIQDETVLESYGAILKSGHRNVATGGTMTGLLFTSYERFTIVTGQQKTLDHTVETSYISLNYSKQSGKIANCFLPQGLADGHRKAIIVSHVSENAVLKLNLSLITPNTPQTTLVLAFKYTGQSAFLQYDAVLATWFILGTGAFVMTPDDLAVPNWMDRLR